MGHPGGIFLGESYPVYEVFPLGVFSPSGQDFFDQELIVFQRGRVDGGKVGAQPGHVELRVHIAR
jgi:hypothetical protein